MPAWSGLFDNEFTDGPHTLQVNIVPLRRKMTRVVKRKSMAVITELIRELNGTVAGDTALAQHVRVQGAQILENDAGGVRPIETVDLINRVTAAADVTDIETMFTEQRDPTYPVDVSGNGGGGKLGF